MQIQHKKTDNEGTFFIEEGGKVLAELVYSENNPDAMTIEHTEVSDELRGQNVGYELVHHAVEYARSRHIKIHPVCSFARSVFEREPEFADVLA